MLPSTRAWSTKDGPGRFSYETNYLVDDHNAIIVDVEATPARLSQEIVATKAMLDRSRDRVGFSPTSLAADKSYGTAPFLAWLLERNVTPFVPVLDRKGQTDGKLTRDEFAYDHARDCFVCPEGHNLRGRASGIWPAPPLTPLRGRGGKRSRCCSRI